MNQSEKQFETILRKGGYRITAGKIALLKLLSKEKVPLKVLDIAQKLSRTLSLAATYRAVDDLVDSGIIHRIDLAHGHAHYELVQPDKHHHHIVCRECGSIEDVEVCDIQKIEHTALKKSRIFSSINTHSMEFFGTCNKCV